MTKKRFKETISTGIVTDTLTGKEYNCEMRIDDELLELLNTLSEENKKLEKENKELRDFKYFVFKNMEKAKTYGYYTDDKYQNPFKNKRTGLNCSDTPRRRR